MAAQIQGSQHSQRILKRKYPVRLFKKDDTHFELRRKNFYYDLIEDTDLRKKPNIDLILTKDIESYGKKGDKISLKRLKAYNDFLLPGLAVYATPENIQKYMSIVISTEHQHSSKYAIELLKVLEKCCLIVNMNIDNHWKLEKWHIKVNFRTCGIYVTEKSITMPKKDIIGPNLQNEGKEFYIKVTINETEEVKVRCRLHHVTTVPEHQLPEISEFWKISNGALFPEDEKVLNALPRPKWEDYNIEKQMYNC
ncbi:PREDICTED: 39S ribosomal protein L9, mitochondrial [Ceratosolen solmsi marchali]|uniref:Large ribosomal subunit protein bL9m n=1 Tax=Ceratosolen solmsi marchali TaxID=326594 RepID=A0AAJ6YED9_9HYME|nr:PREDICTED: 39S ribosomal protein L9, mitochondrial [Ceratosolen solmsi marchali]